MLSSPEHRTYLPLHSHCSRNLLRLSFKPIRKRQNSITGRNHSRRHYSHVDVRTRSFTTNENARRHRDHTEMVCRRWQCCGGSSTQYRSSTRNCNNGHVFGYHITKCHLVSNTDHKVAMTLFENLDVELVDGHRVLGSVIGSSSACEKLSGKCN